MKKKKKRIIILLLIFLGVFICFRNNWFNDINYNLDKLFFKITSASEYKTIKKDTNTNYSGVGQKKIKNKDGYFTTFTTSQNYQKVYIEYKQNGNSSWSNKPYWGDTMSENGCGITAMAIILSGYGKNYTPEDLRKLYYPVLDYDNLSEELSNTFNIKNTDFYYDTEHLSKNNLQRHLKTNRPILICVWNKPHNNRWTTSSHYMVLLASDDEDMVYISNPNGGENDSKSSGWYNFNEIIPYIAKALYIESYN